MPYIRQIQIKKTLPGINNMTPLALTPKHFLPAAIFLHTTDY